MDAGPNDGLSIEQELAEAGMQGAHRRRYGTAVTLIHEEAASTAADVLQAAYFRRWLCAERKQLVAEVSKRRDAIAERTERGSTSAMHRLGSSLRSAEAQVRYVDRLIARLEHRFAFQADGD
jgi:hypothetical protein